MSLVSALMSPNGRLAPSDFQTGALILIGVGFLTSLSAITANGALIGISALIGFAMIYPWVVLWRKRLHDAGHSGWMFLIALIVWIIVSAIFGQIVTMVFAGDMTQAAAELGSFSDILRAQQQIAQQTAIPSAIASAASSLIVVIGGNAVLKSDPETNKYGDPVRGPSEAAD